MENDRKYPVSIDGGNQVVDDIKTAVTATHDARVISPWGAFAGCMDVSFLKEYKEPVLVSSVDSVGSKILLAQKWLTIDHIGHDLVHHCINDILVMGAKPLFFLDYVACSKLNTVQCTTLVKSTAQACQNHGVALMGGETAEIPGMYQGLSADIAGMIVGVVEKSEIIDGSRIREGDIVLMIPSSGVHTNGYSLARKYAVESNIEALLEPHRCYLPELKDKLTHITGLVHITGGGLIENPKRVVPQGLVIDIDWTTWTVPPLFEEIIQKANMSRREAIRTFNMGVGMMVIVRPDHRNQFSKLTQIGVIKSSLKV